MRPGAGCFLFLAVGYAIVILMLPLPASGDIYSYAFYGRIMSVYDANPYVATPSMFSFDPMYQGVPTFWVSTRCVYGPGFSLMSAALAKGIREADSLIFAYRAIAVGATLATLCSPVLLPWYAVWTLPLGWLLPRVPRVAFIATSVAVSLTLVMDDPSRFPNVADLIVWIERVGSVAVAAIVVLVVWELIRRGPSGSLLDVNGSHLGIVVENADEPPNQPKRVRPVG